MPIYNLKCDKCESESSMEMSIKDFLAFKVKQNICLSCGEGFIKQKITKVQSKIERDKDYIIQEAKEDAKKIVEKINAGDEQTINEIYGDKPNQYK